MFGPAAGLAARLPPASNNAVVAAMYPKLLSQMFIGPSLICTEEAIAIADAATPEADPATEKTMRQLLANCKAGTFGMAEVVLRRWLPKMLTPTREGAHESFD